MEDLLTSIAQTVLTRIEETPQFEALTVIPYLESNPNVRAGDFLKVRGVRARILQTGTLPDDFPYQTTKSAYSLGEGILANKDLQSQHINLIATSMLNEMLASRTERMGRRLLSLEMVVFSSPDNMISPSKPDAFFTYGENFTGKSLFSLAVAVAFNALTLERLVTLSSMYAWI